MARPISVNFEKAKEIMYETHGDKISILEFYQYSRDGKLKCNVCGHVWIALIARVARKTGCPNCQTLNDRLPYSFVKEQIEKEGCKLLSKEYLGATKDLKILYPCDHIYNVPWAEFRVRMGINCPLCERKSGNRKHATKEIEIVEFLKNNGLKFISFDGEYKTQKTTRVFYSCLLGHITKREVNRIFSYPTCAECERLELSEIHKGENNPRWKGGTTVLRGFCFNQLSQWKKDSMEKSNYECPITGLKSGWDIHHLYSFGKIISETLDNLNLSIYKTIEEYTPEEQKKIADEFIRLHSTYPLGICLDKEIHKLFHSIYGKGNTTPKDWDDFIYKIGNGQIQI